jgi:hypothetical protein
MSDPNFVKLGEWGFPSQDAPRVKVVVEISRKAKVDKKESDGKNDAKTTFKGKSPADVKVTFTWPEWMPAETAPFGKTPEDVYVRKALRELNPGGPKGGQPWELTHVDAELFDVASVLFESLTVKRTEGTNQITAELSGASWVKPAATAAGKGAAKTPDRANEWKLGQPTPGSNGPQSLDGQKTGSFGGQTPPAVNP